MMSLFNHMIQNVKFKTFSLVFVMGNKTDLFNLCVLGRYTNCFGLEMNIMFSITGVISLENFFHVLCY